MHGYKKVLLSTMPASFLALDLLPFVVCSSNENHLTIPHKYFKKDSPHHKTMSPRVIYEIKIHGILLWASMGFFMPLGVLIIRMFNKEECSVRKLKVVIYIHAILQTEARVRSSLHAKMTGGPVEATSLPSGRGKELLLAFAGAILSIISFENSFNNTHQRIGLALYGAILVQTLIGFGRPKRGTKGRTFWYVFHWIFGTTTSLVGILNTYTGLKAYHKRTSMSARVWSIIFTIQVSLMAFFYLFQEKWGYMQKQGEISGDEPVIVISSDHVDNQKEVLPPPQPSRKSNSLGNYFAKNNALNKLFQAT
ncbi:cytochrome b561 and DOMON domain-containing protein-like protein [Tanacetum coccineum]